MKSYVISTCFAHSFTDSLQIEAELRKICGDILEVLENHLLPSAKETESKVFYHKM